MTPQSNLAFIPINGLLVNVQHILVFKPAGPTGLGYVKLSNDLAIDFKNKEESELVENLIRKLRTHSRN